MPAQGLSHCDKSQWKPSVTETDQLAAIPGAEVIQVPGGTPDKDDPEYRIIVNTASQQDLAVALPGIVTRILSIVGRHDFPAV